MNGKQPRHVLLIDAESYVWDVIRHGLGDGYRTSAVASRSAAIRIINRAAPDVIIVELMLKTALGLPLAIYGLRRDIPVVLTTTLPDLDRRLTRLGTVVLCKPLSLSELRDCVADAVKNPDDNLLRNRTALQRIVSDHREREALLRIFGSMRAQMILALKSAE